MIINRNCGECGAVFQTQEYRLKTGRGQFCSRGCSARFHTKGKQSRNWRGGRIKFTGGYVAVHAPTHPNASVLGGKYVLEHRMVAAEMLGRPLQACEIVHHVNGDKADNRPENLAVMTQAQHVGLHAQERMGGPCAS